jgi:hypothetical protein
LVLCGCIVLALLLLLLLRGCVKDARPEGVCADDTRATAWRAVVRVCDVLLCCWDWGDGVAVERAGNAEEASGAAA